MQKLNQSQPNFKIKKLNKIEIVKAHKLFSSGELNIKNALFLSD